MKPSLVFLAAVPLLFVAGCASPPVEVDAASNPPMPAGGPNWEQVDKSVQRIKDREQNKARLVETARTEEQGFRTMSDDDRAAAFDAARVEIRNANPKMSESDVDKEAAKRADDAKRECERAVHSSAGSTYELKKP